MDEVLISALVAEQLPVVTCPVPGSPAEDPDQVEPGEDVAGEEEVCWEDCQGGVDLKIVMSLVTVSEQLPTM